MVNLVLALLILFDVDLSLTSYTHFSEKNGYLKKNTYLLWRETHSEYKDYNKMILTKTIKECIQTNDFLKSNLTVITRINDTCYECRISVVETKATSDIGKSYVIAKRDNNCSGYCDEMNDLCGECACRDTCNSSYPFYCDCSKGYREVTHCGDDLVKYNGIYNIVLPTNQRRFKAFCQKIKGKSWTTWLSINQYTPLNGSFTYENYKWGFGDFVGLYWLGLDYMYELSAASLVKFTLRVELRVGRKTTVIEYNEFYIDNYSNSYRRYFTSYKGDPELNLMAIDRSSTFKKCSNGGYWWNEVGDMECTGNPFNSKCIRWGASEQCYDSITMTFKDAI